jgi:hypothetical protein
MEPEHTIHLNDEPQKPKHRGKKLTGTAMALTAAVTMAVAALIIAVLAGAGLMHDSKLIASQAAELRLLDSSNTRLAQQQSADTAQLAQVSTRVTAADPASDSNLITCADLRSIKLTVVNGATVYAVPGNVDLTTGSETFPVPKHCR